MPREWVLVHGVVEAVPVPGDVQECQRFLRGVSRRLTVVLSLAKVVLLMTCRARVSELLAVIASVVPIVPLISCRAGVIELLAVIAGIVSIVPLISCRTRVIELSAVMVAVAAESMWRSVVLATILGLRVIAQISASCLHLACRCFDRLLAW